MACQGSGIAAEPYGNRMLQRACAACGGEGTSTQRGGGGTEPSRRAQPAPAHATAAQKLAAYEAELEGVKRGLAGCCDEELVLRSQLALALER